MPSDCSSGRDVWRGWLHGLGYNTRADDRLAKNELLAYLCTEPRGKPLWLLGSARKACAMGEPLFDGDVGGGTDGEALSRLRDVFVARAEVAVPPPHPVAGAGHRARCVWDVARYVFSQQARERCHAALRTSCSILSIERADRCATDRQRPVPFGSERTIGSDPCERRGRKGCRSRDRPGRARDARCAGTDRVEPGAEGQQGGAVRSPRRDRTRFRAALSPGPREPAIRRRRPCPRR